MKRFGEIVAYCIVGSATAIIMATSAWIILKLLGGIFG